MNTEYIEKCYKVAENIFSIKADKKSPLWNLMKKSYDPFLTKKSETPAILKITIDKSVKKAEAIKIISSGDTAKGFTHMDIFRNEEGYYIEMTLPGSNDINLYLKINYELNNATICLQGDTIHKWYGFTSGMMFCYMIATAKNRTVMTHTSSIIHNGKAFLFQGKSGTGKSTHSRMWLENIENTRLLNDDHPIIKVNDKGEVIAYGSPWSGKTPCYKNESAPIGGIIRIRRAKINSIRHLSNIEAYASLTTTFSNMAWIESIADIRDKTIQEIISKVKCWELSCLPDKEAAEICRNAVEKGAICNI